jgi:hypothetical protein
MKRRRGKREERRGKRKRLKDEGKLGAEEISAKENT